MSYLVEQLPHCDLLRLSLFLDDLSCQLDMSSDIGLGNWIHSGCHYLGLGLQCLDYYYANLILRRVYITQNKKLHGFDIMQIWQIQGSYSVHFSIVFINVQILFTICTLLNLYTNVHLSCLTTFNKYFCAQKAHMVTHMAAKNCIVLFLCIFREV